MPRSISERAERMRQGISEGMRSDIVCERRPGLSRRWLTVLLGLAPLAGCNHPSPPAITALSPLPPGATAAPPRINGSVGTPEALPPAQVAYGTAPAAPAGQPGGGAQGASAAGGDIILDFADTDIREVAAQILGTILKVNYTIDPAVRGTATLHTVRPLTRPELL